jgi:hypothetical protein
MTPTQHRLAEVRRVLEGPSIEIDGWQSKSAEADWGSRRYFSVGGSIRVDSC